MNDKTTAWLMVGRPNKCSEWLDTGQSDRSKICAKMAFIQE